uniref:G-protein coupled receptors family 1 profile domain-containing protein n=1 Tax=Clastoptera arizonana TaxID=38151 RepID=A0A1B6CH00_9HEMI
MADTSIESTVIPTHSSINNDGISPVTLSSDWNRVARLLLVVGLAVVGSVGNVYMVSAVMIEEHLKKKGNTFLVNIALADLLITGLVMPASAVVILAGLQDSPAVCRVQWFLAILCWLVTLLTFAVTSIENYARLCCSSDSYARLSTKHVIIIVMTIWIFSSVAATLQCIYDLGPDYCTRKYSGLPTYQVVIAILFIVLPTILTCLFYVRTVLKVRLAKANPSFKPPITFSWDYSLMKTNVYSFILFYIFWLPFGIILVLSGTYYEVSARVYYILAWIALSKSCINNFLYCITNRHFRNAYINLFHYCCCKTTVAFSRRSRGELARPSGDVRVHIIPGYNMYSYTSPQRARENSKSSTSKRTSGTSRSSRANGRDVYQL